MTKEELIKYYADLLILQYRSKPKAYATVEAAVGPVVMDKLSIDVLNGFDLSSAVGAQLDVIGSIVGVSRVARDFSGQVILNDTDFRTLITVTIIKNTAGSSMYEIVGLLHQYFPGALFAFDNQNMTMSYMFDSAFGSVELAEVFVRNSYLPKPMGVQLGALIYSSNIDSFYGFGTYEVPAYNNSGFNSYDDYSMDSPWLSYDNTIFPE